MIMQLEHIVASLRSARTKQQLSQKNLSKLVGLPQGHISKIERGEVDLKTSSLLQIARALDLEPMLIPRKQMHIVKALIQGDDVDESTPAYRLEED